MKILNRLKIIFLFIVLTYSQGIFNSSRDITLLLQDSLIPNSKLNFTAVTGYIPINWYFPDQHETGIFY